jgi:hypothetical protein
MTTPTQQPPMPTTPVPSPETGPATATPAAVVPRPAAGVIHHSDQPRPYWGDRLFLLLCLGCALLIILMNAYDFLKGLLGY